MKERKVYKHFHYTIILGADYTDFTDLVYCIRVIPRNPRLKENIQRVLFPPLSFLLFQQLFCCKYQEHIVG